jgi:putative ABC transport system permease protein
VSVAGDTFGLMSQTVTHGARDIAIRLALGADPRRLAGAIVLESLMAASAGLTIGAVASLLVGNAMKATVYGVRPGDALSFFAAGVTLLFVTAVGALVPALRTIAVDPATVLRAD